MGQEGSGVPSRVPGGVERSSQKAEKGREAFPEGLERPEHPLRRPGGLGSPPRRVGRNRRPPGYPGEVKRPFWRAGSGWESLQESREGS